MKQQRPIKTMILVPGFPRQREAIRGGVHAAVLNLLLGFERLDIDVRLVSFESSGVKDEVVKWSDRIEVHYCGTGKMPFKMLGYLLRGPKVLKSQIRDFRPDIIHYQIGGNFLFTKLAGLNGIPHLLTIHGIAFEEARVNKSWKKKLNMYWNGTVSEILRPSNIINISAYSKQLLRLKGANEHPIIYNAVAMKFFELTPHAGMNNVLLFVGVINERKNLQVLLQALKTLKDKNIFYRLHVVGGPDEDESYYNTCRQYADTELGGMVTFHGWKSQGELLGYLADSDIVVLPSRQETLPMSIAEAMAAGKVVVASNVGGLPEMVTDKQTGFLFESNNDGELAGVLAKLYNNSPTVEQVAAKARSWIYDRCNNFAIAQQTENYYRKILNGKSTLNAPSHEEVH